MEKVTFNGELILELYSKNDWVNRVPNYLPENIRGGEQRIWIDKNGNVFECGSDFIAAEKQDSYPCKVYRVQNVSSKL